MIILLLVLSAGILPLSVWASADFWTTSYPQLLWLVFCILVYLCTSWFAAREQHKLSRANIHDSWPTDSVRLSISAGILIALFGVLSLRPVEKIAPLGALLQGFRAIGARIGIPPWLEPGELAGALVLIVPLAIALCFAPMTDTAKGGFASFIGTGRLALIAASTVSATALVLTQSRAGLLACAASTLAALILLARWRHLLAVGIATIVGGLFVGQDRVVGYLAYGGRLQQSVLTGRNEVWERAYQAILDTPFTGMGLGTFGILSENIYPMGFTKSAVSHAHSLYLETAVALGLPGLLVFLVIMGIAALALVRTCRRQSHNSPARYWTVGLSAGLFAHLLFSVVDAVPLGTVLNVVLWIELGLIMGTSRAWNVPSEESRRVARGVSLSTLRIAFPLALLVLILSVLVVPWDFVARSLRVNLASTMALKALVSEPDLLPVAQDKLAAVEPEACRANWLGGLVAEARGYKQLRNAAWRRLIRCQARFVKLVESVAPSDSELAEAALELQPAEAESYFWLAQLRAQQAPEQAAELYVRGLELRPEDGLRWLELGDLIAGTQPRVALDAYVNACENGDPGANGCYRAGRIAEALNDPKLAIRYYRMSRWSAAISRAEQLERLLER